MDALKTSVNSSTPYITYAIRAGVSLQYDCNRRGLAETSTDSRGAPQVLGVRVAAEQPGQALPDAHHTPDTLEADHRRLRHQAGEGEGGCGDDCAAEAHAADVPQPHRAPPYPVERAHLPPLLGWGGLMGKLPLSRLLWAAFDVLGPQSEVLHSPPISQLPKNILKAPSHNPTDQTVALAYAALPNPSAAHPLRRPDQRFLDSEVFTNKFAAHMSGPMEKVTRRTMKRWSGECICVSDSFVGLMNGRLGTGSRGARCYAERLQSQ